MESLIKWMKIRNLQSLLKSLINVLVNLEIRYIFFASFSGTALKFFLCISVLNVPRPFKQLVRSTVFLQYSNGRDFNAYKEETIGEKIYEYPLSLKPLIMSPAGGDLSINKPLNWIGRLFRTLFTLTYTP